MYQRPPPRRSSTMVVAMSARAASILATIVLMASAIALVVRGGLFGNGPISIGLQLAGLALILWARVTFGLRSFHYAANPTEGGLVTHGPFHYMRIRFTPRFG